MTMYLLGFVCGLVFAPLVEGIREILQFRRLPSVQPSKEKGEFCTTTYHEVGHVVCAWHAPHVMQLYSVSIKSSKPDQAGFFHYAVRLPEKPTHLLWFDIVVKLGGVAAEAIHKNKFLSAGASGDLQKALNVARKIAQADISPPLFWPKYETTFDMAIVYKSIEKGSAEAKILNLCYARAKDLIRKDEHRFMQLASQLSLKGELNEAEILAVFGPRPKSFLFFAYLLLGK